MTPKELQEQYAKEQQIKERSNKPSLGDSLPATYLKHIRNQYERISGLLGYQQAIDYVKDALKDYPDILLIELAKMKKA